VEQPQVRETKTDKVDEPAVRTNKTKSIDEMSPIELTNHASKSNDVELLEKLAQSELKSVRTAATKRLKELKSE
jgi:hypothetical protein